ncbi:MAG: hypothetical protein HeimC2_12430 [Candidatus Heimdallarchaeota archaeon LC_2]|nr:MAG: hypothetical protein HeimC2_12430 [Candidatus Heimdallarchaeota archaeon LC_2]
MDFKKKKRDSLPYKLAYTQLPKKQNWSSSSWWFFILLPKEGKGYGPRQLMFAYASRVGKDVGVNKKWDRGIDLNRDVNGVDQFQTSVNHWHWDGKTMYDGLVHEIGEATMTKDGKMSCWNGYKQGNKTIKRGGSMDLDEDGVFHVNFQGQNGGGNFIFWNTHESEATSPEVTDMGNKFINFNLVAMRNGIFKGTFRTPEDEEIELEGLGYFQRVIMNLPTVPWLWNWTVFADGSVYSYFVPYVGPHAFRRKSGYYNKFLEKLILPISTISTFHDAKTHKSTTFEKTIVIPVSNGDGLPHFKVLSKNPNGDFVKFIAQPVAHTEFLLERRIFKRLWQTRWVYNEYPINALNFSATIDNIKLDTERLGNGFGNCEYTWGMSL